MCVYSKIYVYTNKYKYVGLTRVGARVNPPNTIPMLSKQV